MSSTYIQSELLLHAGAINAVSLRVENKPSFFSMRRNGTAGTTEAENRREFFASLGFDESATVRGGQVHGDNVCLADGAATFSNTDSLLTRRKNLLLTVSVADCVPIMIFDKERKIAAAVHSGWKGTARNIVGKTLDVLKNELNSNPKDLVTFVGPSAGVCCYEVGDDVARHFHGENLKPSDREGKFMLDLKKAVVSQLTSAGVPLKNIDVSDRCTICDRNFHSFRRDGESSGRMIAAIAIK